METPTLQACGDRSGRDAECDEEAPLTSASPRARSALPRFWPALLSALLLFGGSGVALRCAGRWRPPMGQHRVGRNFADAQAWLDGNFLLHSEGRSCGNVTDGYLWKGQSWKCQAKCLATVGCVYYTSYAHGWCELSNRCSLEEYTYPTARTYVISGLTRVLFIGNSFTYVNDLPYQLVSVAGTKGRPVEAEVVTSEGCNLFSQRAVVDDRVERLLQKDWHFIVLQDHSQVPSLAAARALYFYPAVENFVARKKGAKIALYMTMAYHSGVQRTCPVQPWTPECWPLGSLRNLSRPECEDDGYKNPLSSFACMQYAVARGYLSALDHSGADLVVPAGLAWQAARGEELPETCRRAIDGQFPEATAMARRPPPLPDGEADVLAELRLHNTVGDKPDEHPTKLGQYLNALTFYAALFRDSPFGAGPPLCRSRCFGDDWKEEEPGVERDVPAKTALALQRCAAAAVSQCGQACVATRGSSNKVVYTK